MSVGRAYKPCSVSGKICLGNCSGAYPGEHVYGENVLLLHVYKFPLNSGFILHDPSDEVRP